MMTKDKLEALQREGLAHIEAAKKIAADNDGDPSTWPATVRSEYDDHIAKSGEILKAVRTAKDDLAIIEKAREIGEAIGAGLDGAPHGPSAAKDQRLSFASMGEKAAANIAAGALGLKALATGGSVVTSQEFQGDPIAQGQAAASILDVVPVTVHNTDQFAYLRQSVRTNAAAVVAEGAVKPTSTYTLVRVDDRLDVVAHLSEAVPRFWLVDNAALEQFLDNELRYGLSLAVQAMVVADVAGTSGVQTQAYSTSVLQTLRKTLTKLETQGYPPGSIWLNPNDFEAIELALSTVTAVEYQSLPFDAAARRLWGTPLVTSNAVTAGVSYTVAQGAVGLNTDSQGVQTTWSESSNADDWSKNLVRARTEGRYATSVFQPMGVVIGDLTP